jgi:hypothetical protein
MLETERPDAEALQGFMDRLILLGVGTAALAMLLLILIGAN